MTRHGVRTALSLLPPRPAHCPGVTAALRAAYASVEAVLPYQASTATGRTARRQTALELASADREHR